MIAILVCAFCLQRTAALVVSYKIAKDCGPYLLLFIYKGLRSLSTAMHLQKTVSLSTIFLFFFGTAVLVSSFHLQITDVLSSALCLQRTAVLVSSYVFAKYC